MFLLHLQGLSKDPDFAALWMRLLDFFEKSLRCGGDLLSEAIPETLKNMLLVMSTAGILQQPSGSSRNALWDLTWHRVDELVPSLRSLLYPAPPESTKTPHAKYRLIERAEFVSVPGEHAPELLFGPPLELGSVVSTPTVQPHP